MVEKKCKQCDAFLTGRIDKKFCSDQCRSTYYNRLHGIANRHVRMVNNALRKNRRILDELNPGGNIRVPATWLRERGFDFRYHTMTRKARRGIIYYCYEHGYQHAEKNHVVLILNHESR